MNHVLILGGYGATGRIVARLLLERTDARVTLAGRDETRAARAAAALGEGFPGRVGAVAADAASGEALARALDGVDLLLVTASVAAHIQTVARAALLAGADCYDIIYSPAKLTMLRSLAPEIRQAGRIFITDGGLHPGLPAILVRHAGREFDELHSAAVGSLMQQDWRATEPTADTLGELLDMITAHDPSPADAGTWRRPGVRRQMEFGEPFGLRSCYALALEELRTLPEEFPSLRSTGFYVGGFNPVVDWGVIPLAMLGHRFAPQRSRPWLSRLLRAGLRHGSTPPFRTVLKLEAAGLRAGQAARLQLEVAHPDGYYLTAACVAAGVSQLAAGRVQPGLWLQAQAMDPGLMLADLEALGADVVRNWREPQPAAVV